MPSIDEQTKSMNALTEATKAASSESDKFAQKQKIVAENAGKLSNSLKSLGQAFTQTTDAAHLVHGAFQTASAGLNLLLPGIGGAIGGLAEGIYNLSKRSNEAVFQLSGLTNAFGNLNKVTSASTGVYFQLRSAQADLGQSVEQSIQQISQLSEVMSFRDLAGSGLKGLKDFNYISAATGIGSQQLSQVIEQSYRKMGLSIDEAYESVSLFNDVAADLGININRVASDIVRAASGLEIMGIKGTNIVPVYKAFAEVLGKGREHLAGDLSAQFVQGLGKMDTALKAFYGVASGFGGGGALEGLLEFERMFEEGRIGDLGAAIGQTLQGITGAPLMTKGEALSGGEEGAQAFFVQRRMIEQSFGVGFKEAEKISEVLSQAQRGQISSVEAQKSIEELRKSGQQILSERLTMAEKAMIRLSTAIEGDAKKLVNDLVGAFEKGFKEGGWLGAFKKMFLAFSIDLNDMVFHPFISKMAKIMGVDLEEMDKESSRKDAEDAAKFSTPEFRQQLRSRTDEDLKRHQGYVSNYMRDKSIIDDLLGGPGPQALGAEHAAYGSELNRRRLLGQQAGQFHDGSPGFMYQLPKLNVDEAMSVVKRDERVLTPAQAAAVTKTATGSTPIDVRVQTVCTSCMKEIARNEAYHMHHGAIYNS
jgi:hypothetical protein